MCFGLFSDSIYGYAEHYDLLHSSVFECPVGSDFTYACPSTKAPDKELVCIHSSWVCDEDPDCPEGEDEDTGEGGPCHQAWQGTVTMVTEISRTSFVNNRRTL